MTPEIVLVLTILAAAVVLLITEWIPMEVTALLALGAVALTGLVSSGGGPVGFQQPGGGDGVGGVYPERRVDPHRRCQCHRQICVATGRHAEKPP